VKKIYIVLFVFILLLSFLFLFSLRSSNNYNNQNLVKVNSNDNNVDVGIISKKIQMNIKEYNSSGAQIEIIDTNNPKCNYDYNYKIMKCENNEWIYVENNNAEEKVEQFQLINDSITLTINWLDIYGELSDGLYKIEKKAVYDIGLIDFYIYSNTFEIKK